MAIGGGAIVLLSGCGSPDLNDSLKERGNGHTLQRSFSTGEAGAKAAAETGKGTPSWVPAGAKDIFLAMRTTGDERIMTMAATAAMLPAGSCQDWHATQRPARPEATVQSSDENSDEQKLTWRNAPTIKADWWPTTEPAFTKLCDSVWWVGEQDGKLFAFSPELTKVTIETQPETYTRDHRDDSRPTDEAHAE
ncbi:hypothetical protein O159_18030 [Leifsonia xyli subsp. cynodontis DSM 46306]|uniref:Uncharacterized protein n=1 Tax=Leifsonia xyli subsp. cynodontis DSM 46306 TaxID=1389489 RepID=U3PAQ2_LEIXC|nr:hypothetical protein [Leifsonia xyli]AGW41837.1 hypothetical protein O159_18030 [Leifsonia xyli subsp. cynodontis DSM 46306]